MDGKHREGVRYKHTEMSFLGKRKLLCKTSKTSKAKWRSISKTSKAPFQLT